MSDKTYLHWPFFEEKHRQLSQDLESWSAEHLANIDHSDTDELCKSLVSALGSAGWCRYSGVDPIDSSSVLDVRSLCLIRETLARHDGLADFAFAMQGLGTGAISLFGTDMDIKWWHRKYVHGVCAHWRSTWCQRFIGFYCHALPY